VSLTPEEINRKLLHGLAVVLPAGIFYGPDLLNLERWMIPVIMGLLFGLALLIEVIRLRSVSFGRTFTQWFGSMLRPSEANSLTGATYVCGGSFLCSLIALQGDMAAAAAFLSLTLFILGDAAAALVGKAIGRIRIGDKTLEGTLGCFGLCVLLGSLVFPVLPKFSSVWGELTLWHVLLLATLTAMLELFPFRLGKRVFNDNLYVPVLVTCAALAMQS
jgi:dolichol kinase